MNFFKSNFLDISFTKKICLSGILMALIIIFNKVLAINYIIPFARISFGSIALIIFVSIAFGPFYGLAIAAFADILGYFIFDMSSYGWFPQVTLTYALMGFVPFFLYKAVLLIKSKKAIIFIEYSAFLILFAGVTLFLIFNNQIDLGNKVRTLELYERILYPSLMLLLFIVIAITNYVIDKKDKESILPINIYQISFIVFIVELFINFLFGGLMKAWAFGFNLLFPIYLVQGMIMFFNVPYNSYLVFVIMKTSKRFLR